MPPPEQKINAPQARRVAANGWVRRMGHGEGGGSDPHVFLCSDGNRYLVKAANNPQGPRVLVNELVGSLCLDWLEIKHPPPAIVEVPQAVLDDAGNPPLSSGIAFAAGVAWGSEHWQSDDYNAVRPSNIVNREDAAGTLLFDTWVRPFDGRQCRVQAVVAFPGSYEWFPVDQGHCFGSPDWTAADLDAQHTPTIGPEIVSFSAPMLDPFLSKLSSFDRREARVIADQVPSGWLDGDRRTALIRYLIGRANKAVELMKAHYGRP